MTKIFIYIFIIYYLLGIIYIILNNDIPQWYIIILIYFNLKWVFNNRKCTISYYECIFRNIKKEEGILYNILNNSVNIRNYEIIKFFYALNIIMFTYFFIIKNKSLFFPLNIKI